MSHMLESTYFHCSCVGPRPLAEKGQSVGRTLQACRPLPNQDCPAAELGCGFAAVKFATFAFRPAVVARTVFTLGGLQRGAAEAVLLSIQRPRPSLTPMPNAR